MSLPPAPAAAVLGMLLGTAAAARGQAGLVFDGLPLVPRVDHYNVTLDGRGIGWMTVTVDTFQGFVLFQLEQIRSRDLQFFGTGGERALLSGTDLTLLRLARTALPAEAALDLRLAADTLRRRAHPDSTRPAHAVSSGFYDPATISVLLPALVLEPGAVIRLSAYFAGMRDRRTLTFHVKARKRMKTGAGEVDAVKVEMSGYGLADYWVSVDPPRRTLRIEPIGRQRITYELVNP